MIIALDAASKIDPTGTGAIRRRFLAEMVRRFNRIKALVREAVVGMDVLGLAGQRTAAQGIGAMQFMRAFAAVAPRRIGDQAPGREAFAFNWSGDKVAAFMEWLKLEQGAEVLGVSTGTPLRMAASSSWMNIYLDSAYQKGMRDAAARMRGSGAQVGEGWVGGGFNRAVHADRVGLIYTRAYSELDGITAAMDQQISRLLAQGIAEGLNPNQMAREMAKTIDGISRNRAQVLARTEVISAHAEASLNTYQEAGVEGVEVESEWSTAGDDRVCPECEANEGQVFTLEEAHGMIPLHPQCRCAWLPRIVNGTGIVLQ